MKDQTRDQEDTLSLRISTTKVPAEIRAQGCSFEGNNRVNCEACLIFMVARTRCRLTRTQRHADYFGPVVWGQIAPGDASPWSMPRTSM